MCMLRVFGLTIKDKKSKTEKQACPGRQKPYSMKDSPISMAMAKSENRNIIR